MKYLSILLGAVVAIAGCAQPQADRLSAKLTEPTGPLADLGYSVANPVERGNIKLIPIVSNRLPTQAIDDVVTLETAKKNGWVEIVESESESFNAVRVRNTGPKPILLIAGDLVIGGHQDRVVARDTLIEPGQELVVEVFCVEAGRSTGPTPVFEPSSQPVPHKVRRDAMFAQDQGAVWNSVSSFNSSAAASPPTDTVMGGLNAKPIERHIEIHEKPLVDELMAIRGVVGYVLVVDGRIDTAEIFGNSAILRQAAPQLIKGVLAQQAAKLTAKSTYDSEADVETFLAAALSGRRDGQASLVSGGRSHSRGVEAQRQRSSQFEVSNGKRIRGYEVYSRPASKEKGLGNFIHGTYANP